jgi:hypothetical protein
MSDDDSYNGDDNSSNSGSSKYSQDLASAEERMHATPKLAQRETRLVSCSKIVVLLVLVVATISVATATYKFTSREEEEDFNTRVRMRLRQPTKRDIIENFAHSRFPSIPHSSILTSHSKCCLFQKLMLQIYLRHTKVSRCS